MILHVARFGNSQVLGCGAVDLLVGGRGCRFAARKRKFGISPLCVSGPGVYFTSFIVSTLTNGFRNDFTQTVPIVVIDPVALDQQLKAQWQEFAGALAARDKAKAMQFLSSSAQDRYGRVFDTLLASLPEVIASVSAPQTGLLTATVGEYVVTRPAPDGSSRVFLIYFIRDSDGVWRLDTM